MQMKCTRVGVGIALRYCAGNFRSPRRSAYMAPHSPTSIFARQVTYGVSFTEYYAEEAKRVYGDIIAATLPDCRLFVLKEPMGLLVQLHPGIILCYDYSEGRSCSCLWMHSRHKTL